MTHLKKIPISILQKKKSFVFPVKGEPVQRRVSHQNSSANKTRWTIQPLLRSSLLESALRWNWKLSTPVSAKPSINFAVCFFLSKSDETDQNCGGDSVTSRTAHPFTAAAPLTLGLFECLESRVECRFNCIPHLRGAGAMSTGRVDPGVGVSAPSPTKIDVARSSPPPTHTLFWHCERQHYFAIFC